MRIILSAGLLLILLSSCGQRRQDNAQTRSVLAVDTLIGRKTITDEIAGSASRKRAIGYFVVVGKDTSDYTCIFTQFKDNGRVGVDLRIPYRKASTTYRERMDGLKYILPKAAADFNFDSLTSLTMGRLILSGDLAVAITNQYKEAFDLDDKYRLKEYNTVSQFLVKSKLGADLNDLFKPYSIKVEKIDMEKLFFTTKEDLYWASKIETDSLQVPERIIDFITWVKLKKV